MSAVVELFGHSAEKKRRDWSRLVHAQQCPFLGKKCYKVRKSDPDTSIGSCTVLYGRRQEPVIICPMRLTERRQIFTDCFHLLTTHEPGNELHISGESRIKDDAKLAENYRKGIDKGLYKIISKMGISTINSYRGAQLFEIVGLHDEVVELCFKGTVSRIQGSHFTDLEADLKQLVRAAWLPRKDKY